jgi:hypothetical protein
MKTGNIISALIVLLLAAFVALNLARQAADPPTAATAPSTLAPAHQADNLPQLFTPTQLDADANALYDQALSLYARQPHDAEAQIAELLIEAINAGLVQHGFLDQNTTMQIGSIPDVADWENMCAALLNHAGALGDEGQTDLAITITTAVWAMTQRAFENNTLLSNRLGALTLLGDAGAALYQWASEPAVDKAALEEWARAMDDIEHAWDAKRQIVFSVEPDIGDLLNLAEYDQDMTFRVAATLRLGIFQYAPRGRGNRKAILSAIDHASLSDHHLLAQAGKKAKALTREQMRRLQ